MTSITQTYLLGFASSHPPTGDIRESMSTLWYHNHRVDFTAQNVYKGLAGFYLLFNDFDTGNENTGFKLPTFPDFDIPMMFNDKNFDEDGILAFDLANRDGISRLWWAMFPGKANAPWIVECIQWMYGPDGKPIPRAELDKAMSAESGHKHSKT